MDDHVEPENFVIHMVSKMELVVQLHESLLENVDQTQKKQMKTYATRKSCIMFSFFGEEQVWLKM